MIALNLALRQWIARPLRPILCSLAIAAAVALIVGVGAGFDSLRATLTRSQSEILGGTDFFVRPFLKGLQYRMTDVHVQALRNRPEIQTVSPRVEGHLRLAPKGEPTINRVPYEAIGVDFPAEDVVHPRTFSAGGYPQSDNGFILDEVAAEELKLRVGDAVTVDGMRGRVRPGVLTGIVKRPSMSFTPKPMVMLPAKVLAEDIGLPSLGYNTIEVKLLTALPAEQQQAYAKKLEDLLGKEVVVTPVQVRKNSLERTSQGMDFLVVALGTVSGLCAALIIATTLAVGVQERLRQFGQLRCIGASRRQLVTILVADAALLMTLGVILGLIIGFIGSRMLIQHFPHVFNAYVLEPRSIAIAALNGIAATIVGSAIPAWQISRVTPMEAVAAAGKPARTGGIFLAGTIGAALLLTQALLWALTPNRDVRFWTYVSLGIPMIFIGYCLLAPSLLLAIQHLAAPILGAIAGVRPTLLRQAWSRTPWRAAGMIAALMIGVVMYAAVRQRSEGIMASWDFPKVFPDVILFSLSGAPPEDVAKLRDVDGVRGVTPISVGLARLEERVFGSGRVLASGNTMFAAVDVDSFRKMVELEFIQGNPKTAMDRLKSGGAVLVSQEFHVARGINQGDKIPFRTHTGTAEFEVVGIVKSSGIDLMKNFFDLGGAFHDEAISSVLGSKEDGRKYFGLANVNVILVNMDLEGRTAEKAVHALRDRANGKGALRKASSGLISWAFGHDNPATTSATATTPATTASTSSRPATSTAPADENHNPLSIFFTNVAPQQYFNWQATSIIEIKSFIHALMNRIVAALSAIAIAAMCVASLGVANMVIASMHARSYEFGVLRAIGTGRWQLLRMVLAEITLVCLVAGFLGSIAGLHFTFMGTRVDRLLVGYTTPFITPQMFPRMVLHIVVGICVTILLGWLAALVPALRTSFRPQRELLAEGRA